METVAFFDVMAGLGPAIHVFASRVNIVGAEAKLRHEAARSLISNSQRDAAGSNRTAVWLDPALAGSPRLALYRKCFTTGLSTKIALLDGKAPQPYINQAGKYSQARMNTTLKVTAKGQVTLRKELLDHLGVVPGDRIAVDLLPSGHAEIRSARARSTIGDFIGSLKSSGGPRLTIEEINQIAAEGWAGKR